MKKSMKILIIAIAAVIVIAAVVIALVRKDNEPGGPYVMDGPGMVYEWPSYELNGSWVEVGPYDPDHPITMEFREGEFTFTGGNGKETTYSYAFPDDTDIYGKPEGEVYLNPADFPEFDNLIFHEEKMEDGTLMPVISGTIFEYDGRGEIIICEFVRVDDRDEVPEGFRSESCRRRNDAEPIPTYITVQEPVNND